MGMSKYIGAATNRNSTFGNPYDATQVAEIAARCILATHSATLDALRRAHLEEHPDEERNAPRLYLRLDGDLGLDFHWELRAPAGEGRNSDLCEKYATRHKMFILAPDENHDGYSEELLREFVEEYELMTVLEIEYDLAKFRNYSSYLS